MCRLGHGIERKVGHMVGQYETYGFDCSVTGWLSATGGGTFEKACNQTRLRTLYGKKQYLSLFTVNEIEEIKQSFRTILN